MSNRARLTLDEQSFQGLLAAAFTIQEHNDRMNQPVPETPPTEAAPTPVETSPICKQCGFALPSATAPCPNCAANGLRPGERLQRTWASMWLMSQEQGFWQESQNDSSLEGAAPAKPPAPHVDRGTYEPVLASAGGKRGIRIEEIQPEPETFEPTAGVEETVEAAPPKNPATPGMSEAVVPWTPLPPQEIGSAEELIEDTPPPSGWRVKLRFHRADLYLGIAVVVAALALFWPSGTSQESNLHPWERILIAMGIAEAPSQPVHYHGDPNLKVWLDTHAALYYCPGDDLYGKSADGRYTTQREAQSEGFEPAERSVCIE